MHGATCPCCTRRGNGAAGVLMELVGAVLSVAAVAGGRFVSGRPLFRQVGPADATYTEWAPDARELGLLRVVVPRTSWGRRPGYQRQLVRLLATAAAVAFVLAPVITVSALSGAAVVGVTVWVAHLRQLAPTGVEQVRPAGMRAGVGASRRFDVLAQDQWRWGSDPADWMHSEIEPGPVPVRAQAHRMDGGAR